jgi:hypothetical protein
VSRSLLPPGAGGRVGPATADPAPAPAAAEARLGFRHDLAVEVSPGNGVFCFSEHEVIALRGAAAESLVPALDGTRGLACLLRDGPRGLDGATTAGLIARLTEAGLVIERPPTPPTGDARALAYWDACR